MDKKLITPITVIDGNSEIKCSLGITMLITGEIVINLEEDISSRMYSRMLTSGDIYAISRDGKYILDSDEFFKYMKFAFSDTEEIKLRAVKSMPHVTLTLEITNSIATYKIKRCIDFDIYEIFQDAINRQEKIAEKFNKQYIELTEKLANVKYYQNTLKDAMIRISSLENKLEQLNKGDK